MLLHFWTFLPDNIQSLMEEPNGEIMVLKLGQYDTEHTVRAIQRAKERDVIKLFPVISQKTPNTKPPSNGIMLLLMTPALIALYLDNIVYDTTF